LPKEPALAADTVIAAPMAEAANISRLENMVLLPIIDGSELSKLEPVLVASLLHTWENEVETG
jgi:hypothetical protein